MSRELNGEINADNTFKEWTVTNLLSSPAVAETHPKIHVKLAPHLRKVSCKWLSFKVLRRLFENCDIHRAVRDCIINPLPSTE